MDTLVALSPGIAFLFSAFNTFGPGFWLSQGLQPDVYYKAASMIGPVPLFLFSNKLAYYYVR